MSRKLEVVLSPRLLPLYEVEGKIVVVIDILRATSSICVALAQGAEYILPLGSPEETAAYREQGFICAAERNGMVVEGFDIGNSPFSYLQPNIKGARIALTTTNGTKAIRQSDKASQLVVGSFLNQKALANWLRKQEEDVLLVCSGWKDKFNLEDTVFAGALVHELKGIVNPEDDAAIAAEDLYLSARSDLFSYILKSSHAHRFQGLGIVEDIRYCMQQNLLDIVPILNSKGQLVPWRELRVTA